MKKTIGILGGGQLAQMMVLKSHELGLKTVVLSSKLDDPAALVCRDHIQGNLNDISDVQKIISDVDVLTFESEFVNREVLSWLEDNYKEKVFPNPKLMSELADRLFQKSILEKNELPQSPYFSFKSHQEFLEKVQGRTLPMVIKKRKEGYDGKGTFIVKSLENNKEFEEFVNSSKEGFIAEDFIPFKRELAITFSRTVEDTVHVFPLVETKQEEYRCDWVKGPIEHQEIENFIVKIKKFLNAIDYIGVIAFELFDTGSEVLINELAPRVHNSSHYTMDFCGHGQFEAHLRAILKVKELNPLPTTDGFAMSNLIGNEQEEFKVSLPRNGNLHLYNKLKNVKGRKMGHINCCGKTPEEALSFALKAREEVIL